MAAAVAVTSGVDDGAGATRGALVARDGVVTLGEAAGRAGDARWAEQPASAAPATTQPTSRARGRARRGTLRT